MILLNQQRFGGKWTEEKLNIFTEYLTSYITALQKQKFKKIYIDAFAGSGEIVTSDGGQELIGSARRALGTSLKFDHYYFIEKDRSKVDNLQRIVDTEYGDLANRVTIYCGDANVKLSEIIDNVDWRFSRGLLFLDPYATEVDWDTLKKTAQTKAIDMWYLFPLSALNRMLTKDGNMNPKWAERIDKLLGEDAWRTEFYKQDPQATLFDPNAEHDGNERLTKHAKPEHIKKYLINRLQSIFPCVSKHPRVFKNKKNSPLFLFCFAISNNSEKAQKLALKIADHILKPNRK
ncbi:MAG: three-Cys-motif partner protein TcmP [Bacteroidales bacterium]|nr:three-Cys-motif partner protein TcmP [Bacteroidales bacterium]